MGELLRLQQESGMGTGFQKTVAVMAYELGDISKAAIYGRLDEQADSAYRAEARLALSDLLTQCAVLAELLNTDIKELRQLGLERFIERAGEVRTGVICRTN